MLMRWVARHRTRTGSLTGYPVRAGEGSEERVEGVILLEEDQDVLDSFRRRRGVGDCLGRQTC